MTRQTPRSTSSDKRHLKIIQRVNVSLIKTECAYMPHNSFEINEAENDRIKGRNRSIHCHNGEFNVSFSVTKRIREKY